MAVLLNSCSFTAPNQNKEIAQEKPKVECNQTLIEEGGKTYCVNDNFLMCKANIEESVGYINETERRTINFVRYKIAKTKNETYCDSLLDSNTTKNCRIFLSAVNTGNSAVCENINSAPILKICKGTVENTVSYCQGDEQCQDDVYYDFSLFNGINYCDKILNPTYRAYCIAYLEENVSKCPGQ